MTIIVLPFFATISAAAFNASINVESSVSSELKTRQEQLKLQLQC